MSVQTHLLLGARGSTAPDTRTAAGPGATHTIYTEFAEQCVRWASDAPTPEKKKKTNRAAVARPKPEVHIHELPAHCAPLGSHVFVTPSLAHVFPRADDTCDTDGIVLLAGALAETLDSLGLREDCFSVGTTSAALAEALQRHRTATASKLAPPQRTGLLLVDRTLDVCSASLHTDSLADRCLRVLTPVTHTTSSDESSSSLLSSSSSSSTTAASATTSSLASPLDACAADSLGLLPHTLVSCDSKSVALLDALVLKRPSEALMECRRILVTLASNEGIDLPNVQRMGRVTRTQLESFVDAIAQANSAIAEAHGPLLDTTRCLIRAMESDIEGQWERMAGVEKVLGLSLHEGMDVGSQLCQLGRDEGHWLSAKALLGLAVYGRAVVGAEVQWSADESLVEVLADAMQRESVAVPVMGSLARQRVELGPPVAPRSGNPASREQCERATARALRRLAGPLYADSSLTDAHLRSGTTKAAVPVSLLRRLTQLIYDPARPALPDVRHWPTSTFSSSFKSGLSMFLSTAQARPNDHAGRLIVFVVGGVTLHEAKAVHDAVSAVQPGATVLVGGTTIASPDTIFKRILCP